MALAGDKDRAFEYLDAAVASGFDDRGLVTRDPDIDSLRKDPRFGRLLATVQ